MKQAIVFWVLLLSSVVRAQDATPTPSPENPVHAELRVLREHMQDALSAGDVDSLLEGVTDDVVVTTLSGEVLRGKEGLKEYFKRMRATQVQDVRINLKVDELTALYGGRSNGAEFGVANGSSDDRYVLADGSAMELTPIWTAALVRDQDGWKVASFHLSADMFDNPVLDEARGGTTLVGGLALVVGLVIGFFGGRRRKS